MKKLILVAVLSVIFNVTAYGQKKKIHKLSEDERARLTPDQQIAHENDRAKTHKAKRNETTAQKVKRAKKNDKASRKIKPPKPHKKKKN